MPLPPQTHTVLRFKDGILFWQVLKIKKSPDLSGDSFCITHKRIRDPLGVPMLVVTELLCVYNI